MSFDDLNDDNVRNIFLLHLDPLKFDISPLVLVNKNVALALIEDTRHFKSMYQRVRTLCDSTQMRPFHLKNARILEMSGSNLNLQSVDTLFGLIREGYASPHITEIWLGSNFFFKEGAFIISRAIHCGSLPKLKKLGVSRNYIGDEGLASISDAFSHHHTRSENITTIHTHDNQITDRGFSTLCDAFSTGTFKHIKILGCACNYISIVSILRLANSISRGFLRELVYLNLNDNCINSACVEAIANAIVPDFNSRLKNLISLELAHNNIDIVGMRRMADVINSYGIPNIEFLDMSNNAVSSHCVVVACKNRGVKNSV